VADAGSTTGLPAALAGAAGGLPAMTNGAPPVSVNTETTCMPA
jgi:hypothetical protein